MHVKNNRREGETGRGNQARQFDKLALFKRARMFILGTGAPFFSEQNLRSLCVKQILRMWHQSNQQGTRMKIKVNDPVRIRTDTLVVCFSGQAPACRNSSILGTLNARSVPCYFSRLQVLLMWYNEKLMDKKDGQAASTTAQ